MNRSPRFACCWMAAPLFVFCACRQQVSTQDWDVYGGSKTATHYSALTQLDTNNVPQLRVAWVYHTRDADANATQIQVNGLESEGTYFGVSAKLKLFALDAASGAPRWVFDPSKEGMSGGSGYFALSVCRGITLYKGSQGDVRLFFAAGAQLYCVDAHTGRPIISFGQGGHIDLHEGLDRNTQKRYVAMTSPGIIYKDLIIVGTRVAEELPAAPGHIRAYDVHTGKRRWIFHTIPRPGEVGYESWEDTAAYQYEGGVNPWSGFSLDEEKGILFAPLGSASYDFYGGNRKGSDLFANCVVALNAATGERIWHFQTVHHDLWDRDLPTAPVLVDIVKDGKAVAALAQITKSGFVFLFDRMNGQPVYTVTETPVPHVSELPGEAPWPTQPIPSAPAPFVRQILTDSGLNRLVPDSSYDTIRERLSTYKTGNVFNPPSREGTVIFPGFDGGGEWGGPSFDPATGILYVNASEMPWILTMVDVKKKVSGNQTMTIGAAGKILYAQNCMGCHGPERKGGGSYPSLVNLEATYSPDAFKQLISGGRRMMPAFPQLGDAEKNALASFLLDKTTLQKQHFTPTPSSDSTDDVHMPYAATGYNKFLTKEGYPADAPPWGILTAINLNTCQVIWKDTLGDYPEWKAKGIHTGTENYGGSVVTAGGLLFIAATRDSKFRAYNKRTGQLLWETDLPACGFATPSVYAINGKEYVVIACGGGKLQVRSGDSYVAFALP